MSLPCALLDLLDAANKARRAGATETEIAHAAGVELPLSLSGGHPPLNENPTLACRCAEPSTRPPVRHSHEPA